jgi:hypothetical protein
MGSNFKIWHESQKTDKLDYEFIICQAEVAGRGEIKSGLLIGVQET